MLDNIMLALAALRGNKMRSLLTMLGIIIGIAAVISIVTVGNAMTASVNETISAIGATRLTASVQSKTEGNTRMFTSSVRGEDDYLTDEMIADFEETFANDLDYISISESVNGLTATSDGEEYTLTTTGINYQYQQDDSFTIVNGAPFSEETIASAANVIIIEEDLATELFGMRDPIGETIELYNRNSIEYYYVAGVTESSDEEMMMAFSSGDSYQIYMPITKAKEVNGSQDGYSSVSLVFNETADVDAMQEYAETFFASYFVYNDSYTAEVSNPTSMLDTMSEMLGTIQLAIAAVAAISLLVGGIGVMNIMLVSITERTKEIGTRKALGAPRADIMLQFITEAVVICMIGGIIGVILGVSLGLFASDLLGFPSLPDAVAIVGAVSFSMFVGLFFGYYPANKASKLNPIDALRHE